MSILKSNNADYRTVVEDFLKHLGVCSVSSNHLDESILTYSNGLNNTVDMFCKKLTPGCLVIYQTLAHAGNWKISYLVGVVEGFTKNKVTVSFIESTIMNGKGLEYAKKIKHLKANKLIRVEIKEIQSLTGVKYEHNILQ